MIWQTGLNLKATNKIWWYFHNKTEFVFLLLFQIYCGQQGSSEANGHHPHPQHCPRHRRLHGRVVLCRHEHPVHGHRGGWLHRRRHLSALSTHCWVLGWGSADTQGWEVVCFVFCQAFNSHTMNGAGRFIFAAIFENPLLYYVAFYCQLSVPVLRMDGA